MTSCSRLSPVLAVLLVGCLQDFDQYRPDSGGSPPAGGAGGVGGTGGAPGGGGTGGMAPACEEPGDCPVGICEDPTCTAGTCGVTQKAEGTACATGVCSAAGNCVECIDQAQCTAPAICEMNQCATPECLNGVLDDGETDVDCGGPTCPKCPVDDLCMVGSDCITNYCDGGICDECNPGDCEANSWCDPTGALDTCVPDLMQGQPCVADAQCPGNLCVDGFCCNSECEADCESCSSAESTGADGVCSPVAAGEDPTGDCDGNGCFSEVCSGTAGLCGYDGAGTDCGATCTNGTLTESECNGMGMCVALAPVSCGNNLACNNGNTACEVDCDDDGDCLAGFHCEEPNCVADKANGAACVGDGECVSNNCDDDVCCATSCGDRCEACDLVGTVGTCTAIPVGTDPDNECPAPGDGGNTCGANNTCN